MAARTGTERTVRLLLENGANVNAQTKAEVTPLFEAVQSHNYDATSALLEYRTGKICTYQENGQTKTIYHAAIESDDLSMLFVLLNVYDDVDRVFTEDSYFYRPSDHHILHLALEIDDRDFMITNLLDDNIDVNALYSNNELLIDRAVALEFNPHYISIIKKHIVKLIAAEFPICDRNIKAVEGEFDEYLDKCRMEISRIKSRKIEGSNIILMDALHKNYHYLALYLKNVDLYEFLSFKSFLFLQYPIYGRMIFHRLIKVMRRIFFIKKSEEIIYNIFYELQLPDIFVRELFLHLSNKDLRKIR